MPAGLPETFSTWLQLGQKLESEGRVPDAIAAYDRAISLLRSNPSAREIPDRRALGVAWMNRGNVLQKLSPPRRSPIRFAPTTRPWHFSRRCRSKPSHRFAITSAPRG